MLIKAFVFIILRYPNFIALLTMTLTLQAPISQKGQTHSNNSSTDCLGHKFESTVSSTHRKWPPQAFAPLQTWSIICKLWKMLLFDRHATNNIQFPLICFKQKKFFHYIANYNFIFYILRKSRNWVQSFSVFRARPPSKI